MANGRHARGAEHPTAQLDSEPQAPAKPVLDAVAPDAPMTDQTPSGRRRRVSTEPVAPAADLPRQATEETVAGGTGRRRRPAVEPAPAETPAVETPAIPAPTGRRRRVEAAEAAAPVAPTAEVATGTGRRRRAPEGQAEAVAPAQTTAEAPAPLVDVAPRAEEPTKAPVVEIAARSHRRATPAATPAKKSHAKPAPAKAPAAKTATHGHAGNRRKVIALPAGAPSGTALIAGAAAVAVAAAGAIGAASSGSNVAATNASMSGASLLGTSDANALVDSASVNREQARASRTLAREALADRLEAATALQKKQEAAARALAAAKARAQQLALIAQNYRLPVSGYHLTAGFGDGGYHWSNGHTGLDFACSYGTPIRAVAAGQVIFAGWDGSYGWKTVIRHADGTETWYAHQSQILVRKGFVTAGQVIGRVGMTGNTTGPHLHLEVRINDVPVNPLTWLRAHGLRP